MSIFSERFKPFENHNKTPTDQIDLFKYLKKSVKDEDIHDIFKLFYRYFYHRGYEYDINGYTLVFCMPPPFTAFSDWGSASMQTNHNFRVGNMMDFMNFAVSFTPVDRDIHESTITLDTSYAISFPVGISFPGQINVGFIDTDDLRVHNFHEMWAKYIFLMNRGMLKPRQHHVMNNVIDYTANLYAIKFKADMITPVLAAKASGVYPTTLPSGETFGNRGAHAISITNITYKCVFYDDEVIHKEYADNPTMISQDSNRTKSPIFHDILRLFLNNSTAILNGTLPDGTGIGAGP